MRHKHDNTEFAEGVAFGHCKTWLDIYAEGTGISKAELAARVGTLLLGAEGRQVHGASHHMSSLHGQTAEGDKASRKVAVVGRTYRKAQVKTKRHSGLWTAARRKEYSLRMHKFQAKLQRARRAKRRTERA